MAAATTALAEVALGRILPAGLPSLALLFIIAYSTFLGVLACLPRGRALLRDVAMQMRLFVGRVRG
jgi:hypothetical protein